MSAQPMRPTAKARGHVATMISESGRIGIEWSVSDDPKRCFRLRWREQGGPPVRAPERRGFGSRLIEYGLARDLGGTVELSFHEGGVECTIEAPLDHVLHRRHAERVAERDRELGALDGQRHDDDAAVDKLVDPGLGDVRDAHGDDDPIVWRAAGPPLPTVGGVEVDAGDARAVEIGSGGIDDFAVEVDGRHVVLAGDRGQERRVVSCSCPNLQYPHPSLQVEVLEHERHHRRLRRR